ncbi:MAG: type I DNA topoisomerase [Mycoplasmoidaceae bacterium]
MGKKLLIIESPNKIKTLIKYLGDDFDILATVGHIRDLAKFGMGFDLKTFEPKWVLMNDKKEIIDNVKSKSKDAPEIYIATDPDREGEAIAWHIFNIIPKEFQDKCYRISFNEISQKAILESFKNKREINEKWVQSQFARRIIDRLIGFKLSQLMQNKLKAESAGRVQSVALKFIADRQKEIDAFVPTQWFNIDIALNSKTPLVLKELNSKYKIKSNSEIKKTGFNFFTRKEAEEVFNDLEEYCTLDKIADPVFQNSSSKPPYKTSTLQQDAINKLNMSSKKTTSIAQKLYEGVSISGSQMALISYPRTDSVRLSDDFVKSGLQFIETKYGKQYLGNIKTANVSKTNVQDAHEAIRPIDVNITPESIKNELGKSEWDLYNLIWIRTVASLMADAKFKKITLSFSNNKNLFELSSRVCEFDGFRLIYKSNEKEEDLTINIEDFKIGSKHKFIPQKQEDKGISEHFTSPPPRFTQASLISELEKTGVGRPSTYNTMVNIVVDRGYSTLENKAFHITDIGKSVIKELNDFFNSEINPDFTKSMEERLDNIALGNENWKDWLQIFSPEFDIKVKNAWDNIEKVADEQVGRDCPDCGKPLVYKKARKGNSRFIGCSGYPECKHLEPLEKPKILDIICPLCKEHNLIVRKNKKGSEFIACTGFPKCRYLLSMKDYDLHIKDHATEPLPIIDYSKKPKAKTESKKAKPKANKKESK